MIIAQVVLVLVCVVMMVCVAVVVVVVFRLLLVPGPHLRPLHVLRLILLPRAWRLVHPPVSPPGYDHRRATNQDFR